MSSHNQIRKNALPLATVYGVGLAMVLMIWAVGSQRPGGIGMLTRDPSQALGAPFYVGFASNFGMIFWCTAAAVCLFTYLVFRRSDGPSEWSYFFGFAGLVTTMLFLDDFFLFHDEVFPKYLFPRKGPVHMNEKVIMVVYAAVAATFVVKCRNTILRRTDWWLLALAIALLGLSVVSERGFTKAFIPTKELRTLAEDGFKLLGIMGWCHYLVDTAFHAVATRMAGPVQLEAKEPPARY